MAKVSVPKLLDEFILPACLVVAARFLGVFLAGLLWPIEFSFSLNFDLFSLPFIQFRQEDGLFVANSFSWVLVGLALAGAFSLILFRALLFHQDYLHPKEAARIYNKNLEFLIINPQDVSSQSTVWLVLVLGLVGLAAADFLVGMLSAVAFGLLVGISLPLVLIFWQIIARDYLKRKKV